MLWRRGAKETAMQRLEKHHSQLSRQSIQAAVDADCFAPRHWTRRPQAAHWKFCVIYAYQIHSIGREESKRIFLYLRTASAYTHMRWWLFIALASAPSNYWKIKPLGVSLANYVARMRVCSSHLTHRQTSLQLFNIPHRDFASERAKTHNKKRTRDIPFSESMHLSNKVIGANAQIKWYEKMLYECQNCILWRLYLNKIYRIISEAPVVIFRWFPVNFPIG